MKYFAHSGADSGIPRNICPIGAISCLLRYLIISETFILLLSRTNILKLHHRKHMDHYIFRRFISTRSSTGQKKIPHHQNILINVYRAVAWGFRLGGGKIFANYRPTKFS